MASGSISAQLAKLAKDNPPYTKDEEEKVTNAYFFDDHDKWRELIVLHNIRFCFAFSKSSVRNSSCSSGSPPETVMPPSAPQYSR